ncbi:MAG TPA: MerR family transcriptional regulator [Bryobacteraceae bacterium]|nr:MerR family transcriptional regulator [Bryobacteraceae bacterium]
MRRVETQEPIEIGGAITGADGIEKGMLVSPADIPNKLYFKIGEVARLTGVKPYVLRYWETEFNGLGPKKSGTNQRQYRRKDVELVLEIKRLLYEKRFTIEGARKHLGQRNKGLSVAAAPAPIPAPAAQGALFSLHAEPSGIPKEKLAPLRNELKDILELLR